MFQRHRHRIDASLSLDAGLRSFGYRAGLVGYDGLQHRRAVLDPGDRGDGACAAVRPSRAYAERGNQASSRRSKMAALPQPYTEPFWHDIGRMLGRMISAEKISPKKCVVLDLDNTLWGGIIGEDGLGGIQLGDDFPGNAYRDFQRHLLYLKSKGVLLAVASKNNPEDAYEIFDKHDAMVLSRKDIAAFEIHWESKRSEERRVGNDGASRRS